MSASNPSCTTEPEPPKLERTSSSSKPLEYSSTLYSAMLNSDTLPATNCLTTTLYEAT